MNQVFKLRAEYDGMGHTGRKDIGFFSSTEQISRHVAQHFTPTKEKTLYSVPIFQLYIETIPLDKELPEKPETTAIGRFITKK